MLQNLNSFLIFSVLVFHDLLTFCFCEHAIEILEGDGVRLFAHGYTVAQVKVLNKRIVDCWVDTVPIVNNWTFVEDATKLKIEQICMARMNVIITHCSKMEVDVKGDYPESVPEKIKGVFPAIARAILDNIGFKWCGPGNSALFYHDLGFLREVDQCCRAHDQCPVKLGAHAKNYGLVNDSPFTACHCDCDWRLKTCLDNIDDPIASFVSATYFSMLSPKCIQHEAREQCDSYDPSANSDRMRWSRLLGTSPTS